MLSVEAMINSAWVVDLKARLLAQDLGWTTFPIRTQAGHLALTNAPYRSLKVGEFRVVIEFVVTAYQSDANFRNSFHRLIYMHDMDGSFPVHKDFFYVKDRTRRLILAYQHCAPFTLPEGFRWMSVGSMEDMPDMTVLIAE